MSAEPSHSRRRTVIETTVEAPHGRAGAAPREVSIPARKTRRFRRLVWLCVLAAVAYGAYYGFWRFHLKRLYVVRPGVFIRSAQPSRPGIDYLVDELGVKTLICVRRDDGPLHWGVLDVEHPDGPVESDYARRLGVRHLHLPMGGEAYWPWFGPEQFERFFELFDDPDNWPVAVHCVGGRHRTGTYGALFRLEYDRWPVGRALEEMHDFAFGDPVPIHDHNLRTYLPRPRPTAGAWRSLREAFADLDGPFPDYETLVRRLRNSRDDTEAMAALRRSLRTDKPFALCLAQRVIPSADHPLAELACRKAAETLRRKNASKKSWAMSAALIADFGQPEQQQELLDLLRDEPKTGRPSKRYAAVVAGVTNRFTVNRLAFLPPLLDDKRRRVEPAAAMYRYCDTAVAHLASITDTHNVVEPADWDPVRRQARRWFAENPQLARLAGVSSPPNYYTATRRHYEDRDDYRE